MLSVTLTVLKRGRTWPVKVVDHKARVGFEFDSWYAKWWLHFPILSFFSWFLNKIYSKNVLKRTRDSSWLKKVVNIWLLCIYLPILTFLVILHSWSSKMVKTSGKFHSSPSNWINNIFSKDTTLYFAFCNLTCLVCTPVLAV